MYVPSYQMHNVLNVYSKMLRQNMAAQGESKPAHKPRTDRVSLTSEGKRQATIERVSKDILDKISRYGSLDEARQGRTDYTTADSNNNAMPQKMENRTFVFNAIDTINNKRTNTLSVDDSSFLIQRLDQLAKEAGVKKSDSWI